MAKDLEGFFSETKNADKEFASYLSDLLSNGEAKNKKMLEKNISTILGKIDVTQVTAEKFYDYLLHADNILVRSTYPLSCSCKINYLKELTKFYAIHFKNVVKEWVDLVYRKYYDYIPKLSDELQAFTELAKKDGYNPDKYFEDSKLVTALSKQLRDPPPSQIIGRYFEHLNYPFFKHVFDKNFFPSPKEVAGIFQNFFNNEIFQKVNPTSPIQFKMEVLTKKYIPYLSISVPPPQWSEGPRNEFLRNFFPELQPYIDRANYFLETYANFYKEVYIDPEKKNVISVFTETGKAKLFANHALEHELKKYTEAKKELLKVLGYCKFQPSSFSVYLGTPFICCYLWLVNSMYEQAFGKVSAGLSFSITTAFTAMYEAKKTKLPALSYGMAGWLEILGVYLATLFYFLRTDKTKELTALTQKQKTYFDFSDTERKKLSDAISAVFSDAATQEEILKKITLDDSIYKTLFDTFLALIKSLPKNNENVSAEISNALVELLQDYYDLVKKDFGRYGAKAAIYAAENPGLGVEFFLNLATQPLINEPEWYKRVLAKKKELSEVKLKDAIEFSKKNLDFCWKIDSEQLAKFFALLLDASSGEDSDEVKSIFIEDNKIVYLNWQLMLTNLEYTKVFKKLITYLIEGVFGIILEAISIFKPFSFPNLASMIAQMLKPLLNTFELLMFTYANEYVGKPLHNFAKDYRPLSDASGDIGVLFLWFSSTESFQEMLGKAYENFLQTINKTDDVAKTWYYALSDKHLLKVFLTGSVFKHAYPCGYDEMLKEHLRRAFEQRFEISKDIEVSMDRYQITKYKIPTDEFDFTPEQGQIVYKKAEKEIYVTAARFASSTTIVRLARKLSVVILTLKGEKLLKLYKASPKLQNEVAKIVKDYIINMKYPSPSEAKQLLGKTQEDAGWSFFESLIKNLSKKDLQQIKAELEKQPEKRLRMLAKHIAGVIIDNLHSVFVSINLMYKSNSWTKYNVEIIKKILELHERAEKQSDETPPEKRVYDPFDDLQEAFNDVKIHYQYYELMNDMPFLFKQLLKWLPEPQAQATSKKITRLKVCDCFNIATPSVYLASATIGGIQLLDDIPQFLSDQQSFILQKVIEILSEVTEDFIALLRLRSKMFRALSNFEQLLNIKDAINNFIEIVLNVLLTVVNPLSSEVAGKNLQSVFLKAVELSRACVVVQEDEPEASYKFFQGDLDET